MTYLWKIKNGQETFIGTFKTFYEALQAMTDPSGTYRHETKHN